MTLRPFSYGGGVQSTAALVLAAQGRIPHRPFLFANVGDDSENPGTLAYLDKWARPFAEAHGLEIIELRRTRRDGSRETLLGRLTKEGSRSLPIPVRMADTGAPGTRACTVDFKIRVIGRWLREHGATEADPARVAIGISTDEVERMGNRRRQPYELVEYPLIDLRLDRAACAALISRAGLPVPPKSSCWFCPLQSRESWRRQHRNEPELFDRSVALEGLLNERRTMLGKDEVYFHRSLRPLAEVVGQDGQFVFDLEDEATCDSGSCFT